MTDPIVRERAPDTLGSFLRHLRVAEPYLTQRQAAAAIKSDPQWLSQVEADRIKPDPGALSDLSELYGVDMADLIPLWNHWQRAPDPDYSNSICTGRTTT